jgi:hypothetical protein
MWRYYFAYCEAGFAERRISDVQMVFARPGWRPPQLAYALSGIRAETRSSSQAPQVFTKAGCPRGVERVNLAD